MAPPRCARHSRVKSSTIVRHRIRLPGASQSCTKSIDHLSFGIVGTSTVLTRIDLHVLFRFLDLTWSPSSRYIRSIRLWLSVTPCLRSRTVNLGLPYLRCFAASSLMLCLSASSPRRTLRYRQLDRPRSTSEHARRSLIRSFSTAARTSSLLSAGLRGFLRPSASPSAPGYPEPAPPEAA